MFFFILAQTATAIPVSSSPAADLQTQLAQAIVVITGAFLAAVVAAVKAWIEKKVATKLTTVTIEGVERTSTTISGTLRRHLGSDGLRALRAVGIDVDVLGEKIVTDTKRSIKAASVAAGTEPSLAAVVAKVTTASAIPAVDANGNVVNNDHKE